MLRITLDVKSGVKEFVVPPKVKGSYIEKFKLQHNPENRHKFLKGLLLYLMGERVSLYALDNDQDDALWSEQKQQLDSFFAQIELKGCIKPHRSNIDLMSFTQHRKHGVPLYGDYQFNGNDLIEVGEHGSRLNERYAPFIINGLFDAFDLTDQQISAQMTCNSWTETREKLKAAMSAVLDDDKAFSGKNLTLSAAKHLLAKLDACSKHRQPSQCAKVAITCTPQLLIAWQCVSLLRST
ncbi:hypothetical protein CS022_22255 [Veronia nyctiphanis]|uniref:Uncharacterized protein n=1 Tax=Veronia nyctiphanis TaxID=1278244 RepID=A0A4Q0YJF9_9GAMM|nr:hypothetical protein [Veronia nyctiphanis]RXJ70850.1 hypothetical protein CS022_22255 [Veronia nyctiphanis]